MESLNGNTSKTDETLETEKLKLREFLSLVCKKSQYLFSDEVEYTKITSLDLSNCNINTLPHVLNNLPVKELNMSKNCFVEIPQILYCGLEKLESLDLSHNEIGVFEFEPKCCKSLKTLSLEKNKLKNIPQWILCLRAIHLETLIYDLNKITYLRCIFDKSNKFTVRNLSLKNCVVREADIRFLKECPNLEELDLSNLKEITCHTNVIQNVEQLFVQPTWKNISILKLNNLSISIFPVDITWLETLTELYLSDNYFMWLPKDGLEFLVNLEVLDLSHNCIYNIPEKLTWLEHLKILNFSHNDIETTPDFPRMKSLEILDLYSNKLYSFDHDLSDTRLQMIDLEYNYLRSEECSLLVNYKSMRDNFRKGMDESRSIGVREFHDYDQNSESDSSYTSDEEEINQNYSISTVSEDWDEEILLTARMENVSPSDDEWQGYEEDITFNVPKGQVMVNSVINEDVIFCDAD